MLIYNPEKGEAIFVTDGAARNIGTQDLVVPANFSADTVYDFIAFISEDGKEVSNSKYVGEVVVAS